MHIIKSLFYFIISFLLTTLFLDFYLQIGEISPKSLSDYTKEGILVKKNTAFTYFNEGFIISKSNKYGYYGPNYSPLKKNSNALRIALIGDSFIEAHQVFYRNYFGTIIEHELKKENIDSEVLNFGRSGFNFNDDFCYYQTFVKKFNPDIVLFFISNEDFQTVKSYKYRPYCEIVNDSLKINFDFINNKNYIKKIKTKKIRGKSAVLYLILKAVSISKDKNQLFSILFEKFYKNKTTKHMTPKIYNIPKELIKILDILNNDPRVYLVVTSRLNENLSETIKKHFNEDKMIELYYVLDNLKNNNINPFYWKATNKEGHWNHIAHKSIGKFLSQQIIKIKYNHK